MHDFVLARLQDPKTMGVETVTVLNAYSLEEHQEVKDDIIRFFIKIFYYLQKDTLEEKSAAIFNPHFLAALTSNGSKKY